MGMKKFISSLLACAIAVGAMIIPSANGITAEAANDKLNLKVTYSGVSVDFDWEEIDGATQYILELVSPNWKTGAAVTLTGTTSKGALTANGFYSFETISDTKHMLFLAGCPVSQKSFTASIYAASEDKILAQDKVEISDYTKLEKTVFGPADTSNLIPQNVKAVAGNKSIKLTWDKMDGVSEYEISISEADKGKYTLDGTSKTNSYTIKNLVNGKKYDILISAKDSKYAESIKGIAPKADSKTTKTPTDKLAAPTGFKASKSATKIVLKWGAVDGADAYRVYKYNPETKKYEKYKTVKNAQCSITGLTANTKYKFIITALDAADGKYKAGTNSKAVAVTTKAK